MWKRFEENQNKINEKKELLKKKIDENEKINIPFKPQINRDTKYYKNENNDFLKRVEIYKFVSEVKKSEIKSKEKSKEKNKKKEKEKYSITKNKNQNIIQEENNLKKLKPIKKPKISITEVKKNIDEKLKLKKEKDQEREENYIKKLKEKEKNEMLECTFTPKLLDASIKIAKSLIRSKSQINNNINNNNNNNIDKFVSVSKILDTDTSKKIKLENLDTSETNCHFIKKNNNNNNNKIINKDKKRNLNIDLNKNKNKSSDKINNNINNNLNNFSMRKDYSISRLEEIPEKRNLKINQSSSNCSFDLKGNNNNNDNKSFSNLKTEYNNKIFVISKKESDIIMELLRNKVK
jgi:hypothetical protein